MARKKMTTYADENLLRSAKILAAKRDGKIYEVFEAAYGATSRRPASASAEGTSAEALAGAALAPDRGGR